MGRRFVRACTADASAAANVFLDGVDVAQRVHRHRCEHRAEFGAKLVDDSAGFGQVKYAARDEVGSGDEAGLLAVDRDDDHHDAVVRERLAIAQHRFADVADARTVDEDVAAVRLADLVAELVR